MADKTHFISSDHLDIQHLREIHYGNYRLELSTDSQQRITRCREYLEKKLKNGDGIYYGINTGFGALCNTPISSDDLHQLQKNLVRSHACGVGDEVPAEIVKLMLLLKIQGLSFGYSGVRLETIQRLIDFYNQNVLPVIFQSGSLGASGDLAPLAHLSLPLIGEGEVNYNGIRQPADAVLKILGWTPVELQSKEGLALLNGTQFMSAYGVWCLMQSHRLSYWADTIAAISLEAFGAKEESFDPLLHKIRPHNGQVETAKALQKLLKGSELMKREKKQVQDPYSFRCIPQVHGASKDVFAFASSVFTTEINSVTDNPTIFPEEDKILSGGNFHGQPLALSLDNLCIALAELGSISERRTFKLLSGQRGLPPFLAPNAGLNSGMMIPQYVAASLVNQNKQLCTPASVDTIDSSNGQEDHVSMGANAATKCSRVVMNLERILAIELLVAAQAMEFRRPVKTSSPLEKIISALRIEVPFMEHDRVIYPDIEQTILFVRSYTP